MPTRHPRHVINETPASVRDGGVVSHSSAPSAYVDGRSVRPIFADAPPVPVSGLLG